MSAENKAMTEIAQTVASTNTLHIVDPDDDTDFQLEISEETLRDNINSHIKTIEEAILLLDPKKDAKDLAAMERQKAYLEAQRCRYSFAICHNRLLRAVDQTSDIDAQFKSVLDQIPIISSITDPDERAYYPIALSTKCEQLLQEQPSIPLQRFMARQGLSKITDLPDATQKIFKKVFDPVIKVYDDNAICLFVANSYIYSNRSIADKEMDTLSDTEKKIVQDDLERLEKVFARKLISK